MIQFSLNGINLSDNVGGYKLLVSPISGNSFPTANGDEINKITGYKQQLNISLTQLDTEQSEAITAALNNPKISIVSNVGTGASGEYNADGGYSVNLVKQSRGSASFKGEWEISFACSRIIKPADGL